MTPRIAICPQVYPPEIHPTAVMAQQLAHHLAACGWAVCVCAGLPHHPSGRLYPGVPWRWHSRSADGRVTVLRTGHFVHPGRSMLLRSAVFASQAVAAGLGVLAAGDFDVVLVVGPPLAGPICCGLAARAQGAKLVNVIYDIYPDVAVDTGKLTNGTAIHAARVAERWQYRLTDLTVVLSEGFRRTMIARGVAPDRVAVVPVWLDPDEIRPGARLNAWRAEQDIGPDRFVVLYAGTIGVVSGAAMVADAAALLADRPEVLVLFVGDGESRAPTGRRARDLGLRNVRFLPFQPRDVLAQVQATADVALVTLAPGRGRTSVPSKVVGYLAAGRPVVASVDDDSDTAQQLRAADAGIVCAAGSPAALAAAVRQMVDDPELRLKTGANARRWFEEHFARDLVLGRFEALLRDMVRAGN